MSTSSRSVWVLSVLSGESAFHSVHGLRFRSASESMVRGRGDEGIRGKAVNSGRGPIGASDKDPDPSIISSRPSSIR